MTAARIPKSFYTLQSQHEISFTLEEDSLTREISFVEGNYNVVSFPIILKQLLEAASLDMGHAYVYNITYPDDFTEVQTELYTYTVSNNGGIQPKFIFTEENSRRIVDLMGFDFDQTVQFDTDVLYGQYSVSFQLTKYLVIRSNICVNTGNSDADSSVLARLDISNVKNGDTLDWQMTSLEDSSRILRKDSNVFAFSIYDDRGRLLDLFEDWNISLVLYEYNNSNDLLINDLKLKHLIHKQEEDTILLDRFNAEQEIKAGNEEGIKEALKQKPENKNVK